MHLDGPFGQTVKERRLTVRAIDIPDFIRMDCGMGKELSRLQTAIDTSAHSKKVNTTELGNLSIQVAIYIQAILKTE